MRTNYSRLLRSSFRVGMPILAAACFSIAGMAMGAEPAAQTKPAAAKPAPAAAKPAPAAAKPAPASAAAKPAPSLAQQVAAQRTPELEKFMQRLNAARAQMQNERDADALAALIQLVQDLNSYTKKQGASTYTDVLKKDVHADFVKQRQRCGEIQFQDAKKSFQEALHYLRIGSAQDGTDKAQAAREKAGNAKKTYYLDFDDETNKPVDARDKREKQISQSHDFDNKVCRAEAGLAQPLDTEFAVLVDRFCDQCDKIIADCDFKSTASLQRNDPNRENRLQTIDELYTKAEKLYRVQQYTKARDLCEQIFVQDPYNQKAIRLLDKIYKKLYFYSELRVYNEMLRADAEVVWSYAPEIPNRGDRSQRVENRHQKNDELMEKLKTWKIDVDFKDYGITDAINKIREKSVEVDPAGVGINFQPKNIKGSPAETKLITLRLDRTPISDVLNYFCKMAGITWTTDDDDMFVVYGNGIDEYETRHFPLRYSVYQRIAGDESSGEGESGDGNESTKIEDGVEAQAKKKVTPPNSEELKRFFAQRGVPFDSQSTISYNRRSNTLSVKNTRENLNKMEGFVRQIDVENPLILVESKILEIRFEDEEELGFDWVLTHVDENPNWSFAMESPLRASGLDNNKFLNNLNVLPNFNIGSAGNLNLYLTITAVDRTNRVEILSTPKVVATNATQATIKMVHQEYFPESWNEPDTSNVNGTSMEFSPSYPEFGEARDVGIVFEVTPEIGSNNSMITLALQPSVTDLYDWSDYSYDVVMIPTQDEEETKDDEGKIIMTTTTQKNITKTHVLVKMPQISKREVQTNVKVFDGQTLVIGGIMTDSYAAMEDRFPILGDIPIFGRLFTKTASKDERRNMIISVTTRLIYGDGSPVNVNPPNGLPDFRR